MKSDKMEKRLKKICQNYDVISFDVFDTLLKRDVMSPIEVFSIVEQIFDRAHEGEHSAFAQKRIKIEYLLRKTSSFSEITLDEIYEKIDFPQKQAEELKSLEVETEAALLHANYVLKRVYDFCIEQKKIIYLISDMYLPLPFLKNVLGKAGYKGYQKLYLSCEYRKTKFSGKLFQTFLKEEGLNPKKVLHIGDNFYADLIGARKAGVRCWRIPQKASHTFYMPVPQNDDNLSKRSLYAFVNNHECSCQTRTKRLGYELLGPLIYGYCSYLHSLPERKGRKVWFAARDMYLFEKAYRLLYPEDDVEYIYLSRKSLRPVYAKAIGNLAKSGEAFPDRKYTLSQVIRYMGYKLEEAGISETKAIKAKTYNGRALDNYPEIQKALSSPTIVKKEAELAAVGKDYLEQHGLFSTPILLADVGWHGTIQLLLEKIREQSSQTTPIVGYYLGCCDGTNRKIGKNSYIAWLFNEYDDRPFMRGIVLLESLILAPHGSTIGFNKRNGKTVDPILETTNQMPETVLEVQQGAMAFINDYHNSILHGLIDIAADDVCAGFEKFEMEPLKEDLETIGELDYENFYQTKIASPKPLIYYLFHWKAVYNDFMYAGWRTGFMYRLFKIRLPYGKLYNLGRKFWRKMKAKS